MSGAALVLAGAFATPRRAVLRRAGYALLAALALVGTWSQNLFYVHPGDGILALLLATVRFWPATLVTPASVSVTVDLGLFFVAAAALMVVEARRLGIRFVWLYVVLGFVVAISVTFPLFLIAREQRLAVRGDDEADGALGGGDVAGLAGCVAAATAFTLWTLLR